jgi:peptide-methionine (S)-S-oxide reductase
LEAPSAHQIISAFAILPHHTKYTIADVEASGIWPGKVVTEVAPAGPFWEAEPEHQDYLEKYPDGYTCHFVRPNWELPHRAEVAKAS